MFELQERDKKHDLAYKRSFFVRMVSDPKIYNPKIAGASPRRHTHLSSMDDDFDIKNTGTPSDIDEEESEIPTSTWVLWSMVLQFRQMLITYYCRLPSRYFSNE